MKGPECSSLIRHDKHAGSEFEIDVLCDPADKPCTEVNSIAPPDRERPPDVPLKTGSEAPDLAFPANQGFDLDHGGCGLGMLFCLLAN
ncbi:MAG: hypothetical protein E5V24_01040 [Mesorhizobium sp.]|nr:MAG: hypothetical protein E5V24_01040 [Mesorhizobium sp.]